MTSGRMAARQRPEDDRPTVRLMTRGRWRMLAACQSIDPELFFPVSASGKSLEQVTAAKAVCAACPVRRECLAFALRTGQVHGIWGGRTVEERHQALREEDNRTRSPDPARLLAHGNEQGDQIGDEEDVREEVRG
jgi:WhiB family transcriptional regulator, redox-sensing transcriptional regulator